MTGDASLFIPPAGSMTVVMTSDYSYCMLKIGAGTVTFHATWDLFDIDIDRGTVQWGRCLFENFSDVPQQIAQCYVIESE